MVAKHRDFFLAAQSVASPHQDARPPECPVDMIVLHAISLPDGVFDLATVLALFTGTLDGERQPALAALKGLRVSSHYVIDRQGRCVQCVPPDRRAWHAGVSCWQGRERCNDFSIGIELLGDIRTPFTLPQYHQAARLCAALMRHYPHIHPKRIVGHSDIAPARKWDPGPWWDWPRFRALLVYYCRHQP